MADSTPQPPDPANPTNPNEPTPDAANPIGVPQSAHQTASTPPVKKRRRRLWPRVVLAVLVVLVLFVALLPTIASTGAVRRMVVGQINKSLNGSVEISDWSIGWTSGIDIHGVRVFDDQQRRVIEVARIRTNLSLLNAIRGNYDCGDTEIDEPNLIQMVVHADGTNNLQSLLKPSAKSSSASSSSGTSSAKKPQVKINLHINRPRGTVIDEGLKQQFVLDPASDVVVKVTSLNDPIQNAITLVCGTGSDATRGTLTLNGSVSINAGPTNETVQIAALSLGSLGPLLNPGGKGTALTGVLNAKYDVAQISSGIDSPMSLKGGSTIDNFTATPAGQTKPALTEKQLVLTNDLIFDPVKKSLNITNIALDTKESDLLHIAVKGGISDLGAQQVFDNLQLTLGYDLEKIWPVIKPMLSPAEQEDLKEFVIRGKTSRVFTVRGSYPAGLAAKEALKKVIVNGSLLVDHTEIYGMTLDKIEVPVSLESGIAKTIYGDKPTEQQLPPPMVCNGGQVNIGGISVDLNGDIPRLTIPKKQVLVSKVTLNPLLSDKLGQYVNPTLANAKRAQGLLDVTANECDGVALNAVALKSKDSGKADILYSVSDLNVINPFGSLMLNQVATVIPQFGSTLLQAVGANKSEADTFEGSIVNSKVIVDHGKASVDTTLELVDKPQGAATQPTTGTPAVASAKTSKPRQMPLSFAGDVDLANLQMSMNANLPTGLIVKIISKAPGKGSAKIAEQVGAILQAAFPNGIPFKITGTPKEPKLDFNAANLDALSTAKSLLGGKGTAGALDSVIKDKNTKASLGAVGDIINGVTGKTDKPADGSGDSAAPNGNAPDLINNLLGAALNKKKPKQPDAATTTPPVDQPAVAPPTTQPRRGRTGRTHPPATAPGTPDPAPDSPGSD